MGNRNVKQYAAELDEQLQKDWQSSKSAFTDLDSRTKVPHLLIEIRSFGYVEVQGKDTGGIYEKLDAWLRENWQVPQADGAPKVFGCVPIPGGQFQPGPRAIADHARLCDMSFQIAPGVYKSRGFAGENNMGKLSMQLARFMTQEQGWTLQVCDGGNLGRRGQIREQQMKFKAPHPLNLVAPLIMIELRQVGFIEVNGPDTGGIHSKLRSFITEGEWKGKEVPGDPNFCDLKFSTPDLVQSRSVFKENNMGLRTMELVDFMVKECKWTMVTCNTGNFGRTGSQREQQLVFRNDEHIQHGIDHVMVELRTAGPGYIEINGLHDAQDLVPELTDFITTKWQCKEATAPELSWQNKPGAKFCDLKYECPPNFYYMEKLANNLGKRSLELAELMHKKGWALMLCNGGSITPDPWYDPNKIYREQQLKFTRAKSQALASAPLIMIELRTQPYRDNPIRYEGFVEISGRNTNGVYDKLHTFLTDRMQAVSVNKSEFSHCDVLYKTNKIRLRPSGMYERGRFDGYLNGESNIGQWTMRLCDLMVDHLGEWDLIVCNSDNLGWSFIHYPTAGGGGQKHDKRWFENVTAREMQLVFRFRAAGKNVFMSASSASQPLGRPPLQPPPYWLDAGCMAGEVEQKLHVGTAEELAWMQQLLDGTFKQKATRDRVGGPIADRFIAVQCLRSEHPALWDRFAERRQRVAELCKQRPGDSTAGFITPKTSAACEALSRRCVHVTVGNPANQAYLLHGTNPTAAVAILAASFTIDLAGKSAGTMFGAGVYLAESSSKADEYARDDVGGEYDGLYAMMVCRVALGKAFVTESAGDFADKVKSGEYDHVLGDRESAVGTFREFVLFDESSIYPEYAVFYRRHRGEPSGEGKRE